ncbi:MAG: alginate export family protein [Candidatus Omnitrophica bacterium]|nr:alginate export family protein [Candidatus Omnitrophota bacterium]
MSKRLIVILALAFVVGLTCAAYAEVQNVKVSGDMIMTGFARNTFDLKNGGAGDKRNDNESNIISQIRLRVDADLTDNVSTTVRLINERSWGKEDNDSDAQGKTNIDLDLAYVTLKEFLYSPLTVTVGRQDMRFGNGLIIGNARNYDTKVLGGVPSDLTERKAFDAVRATLNYDPLIIDLVAAKIVKHDPLRKEDTQLLGVNASYAVSKKINVEGYFFSKRNSDKTNTYSNVKSDEVYTLGGLVSVDPLDGLKTSLEAAYQFGTYNGVTYNSDGTYSKTGEDIARSAYAIQAKADYAIPKFKKYSPSVGFMYTLLSGSKSHKLAHIWDSMYYDQALNNIAYAIIPFNNLQVINLIGKVKPMQDVTLIGNLGFYGRSTNDSATMTAPNVDSSNSSYGSYTMTQKNYLGTELDLTATYDYTEDVQFGLTAGLFAPGKAFIDNHDATQLIGSMKVVF